MKKHIFSILILCFILTSFEDPIKSFEGRLTYGIEYIDVPKDIEGMQSLLPQSITMLISGDKTRLEQDIMGGKQTIIIDNNLMTGDILMDMMGQKIHIHMSKEDFEKESMESPDPEFEYPNEKKVIQGYKCKLATSLMDDGGYQRIWFTKQIRVKHNQFKKLNGFPLEYETFKDDMHTKTTVTKLERFKVDQSLFAVPEGYKQMSMDELNTLLGKN